jgi:disulfide bond formation protein DsbB
MMLVTKRNLLLAGFLFSIFLIVYALYAQYVLGLEPCPLCILQRVAVIALGLSFLLLALRPPQRKQSKFLASLLLVMISSAGVGIAARHVWIQNLPPEKVPGCGPGLDFMIANFPLSEVLEMVFSGSGECAEISWSFAFLSMPAWVIIWLIVLGSFGVWSIHQRRFN